MPSRPPPPIKSCPVCGLAMLASRSTSEGGEYVIFNCLGCNTVISLRDEPKTTSSPTSDDLYGD